MSDTGEIKAPTPTLEQFLALLPVFRGLTPEELRPFHTQTATHMLETGQSLLQEGQLCDSLYIVLSGCLTVQINGRVDRLPTQMVPGEMIDEAAMRFYLPHLTELVAAQPSTVCSIPTPHVEAAFHDHPHVRERLSAATSRHLLLMEIASAPMFRGVEESLFSRIAEESRFLSVKRGGIVIREGDPSDGVYLVASGALEVFREDKDGHRQSIEILREGACVGELAALLNEPRTTSVRAWRDALLIKIPDSCMQQVLENNSQVTLRLARTLGERLKRTTAASSHVAGIKTVAIIPLCPETHASFVGAGLQQAIERSGKRAVLLTRAAFRQEAGGLELPPERHARWIAENELRYDYVLCQCDDDSSPSTLRTVEQADLVLFVGMLEQGPRDVSTSHSMEAARALDVSMEVVLLREGPTDPSGTENWLKIAGFAGHHHVCFERKEDLERVARRITGKGIGLILGGGGARGLAHLGVLRALKEAGISIDVVGGTSMGAVIAAMYAAGLGFDEMLAAVRLAYVANSGGSDLTLPFVSLCSGGGTIRKLRRIFGERRIEDLPMNYFCVSCDLTRAESVVHDRGPVWLWARVSCSVPGLLPPFPYEGRLLVDGGLLDNLPVSVMRNRCHGYVIASDVSVAQDLPIDSALNLQASWSGISHLMRKLTHRPRLPHIAHLLMRSAEISSVRDSKLAGSPANLYLHPPIDEISMTDFQSLDRIVNIGYEYGSRKLLDWKSSYALSAP